jgi:hypothetical protein
VISSSQRTTLEEASAALSAEQITTLQFTASAATFSVGQSFTPNAPWPRVTLTRYAALLDGVVQGGNMEAQITIDRPPYSAEILQYTSYVGYQRIAQWQSETLVDVFVRVSVGGPKYLHPSRAERPSDESWR